mmetsp:Transcript_65271/g.176395  ORF Transcript_65271/g.176395 Transcript_65271/m.176395 type:complete len:86 (-) Transcript_65271:679-936(-)
MPKSTETRFSTRYCRKFASALIWSLLRLTNWVITAVILLTKKENDTSPNMMTKMVKARSTSLQPFTSIDAGINCVIDQCRLVRYL